MSSLSEIVTQLHAEPRGTGWRCCCPSHDDHSPSLDLDVAADGRILAKCRANCSQDDLIAAFAARGLSSDGRPGFRQPTGFRRGGNRPGVKPLSPEEIEREAVNRRRSFTPDRRATMTPTGVGSGLSR